MLDFFEVAGADLEGLDDDDNLSSLSGAAGAHGKPDENPDKGSKSPGDASPRESLTPDLSIDQVIGNLSHQRSNQQLHTVIAYHMLSR